MYWLASKGSSVAIPLCTCWHRGRWSVAICTRGGNRSWNGVVKRLDASRCDYLFVLVGDGRRWFIPSHALGGGTNIHLGGPKYSDYEVERGDPITGPLDPETASRIEEP